MPRTSAGSKVKAIEVLIASGQSLSAAVELSGLALVGIIFPAAWDAAAITLQNSQDNSTFVNVYDTAGEVSLSQAGASRQVMVNPDLFRGLDYVKLRSGTAGTPVNQTANRTLVLLAREV